MPGIPQRIRTFFEKHPDRQMNCPSVHHPGDPDARPYAYNSYSAIATEALRVLLNTKLDVLNPETGRMSEQHGHAVYAFYGADPDSGLDVPMVSAEQISLVLSQQPGDQTDASIFPPSLITTFPSITQVMEPSGPIPNVTRESYNKVFPNQSPNKHFFNDAIQLLKDQTLTHARAHAAAPAVVSAPSTSHGDGLCILCQAEALCSDISCKTLLGTDAKPNLLAVVKPATEPFYRPGTPYPFTYKSEISVFSPPVPPLPEYVEVKTTAEEVQELLFRQWLAIYLERCPPVTTTSSDEATTIAAEPGLIKIFRSNSMDTDIIDSPRYAPSFSAYMDAAVTDNLAAASDSIGPLTMPYPDHEDPTNGEFYGEPDLEGTIHLRLPKVDEIIGVLQKEWGFVPFARTNPLQFPKTEKFLRNLHTQWGYVPRSVDRAALAAPLRSLLLSDLSVSDTGYAAAIASQAQAEVPVLDYPLASRTVLVRH
ncbi:hypothetical protein B0H10DRAFT_2443539 [Mycena sp. CBHHK59/15]|nr:hypothetical protein B0H10DRAFT_2443539 [Mycena sp. CBHHK59/15]